MKLTVIERYALAALIFLVPTNLFLKIAPQTAYMHGILVDYLIPKFFLSDIPILILVLPLIKKLRLIHITLFSALLLRQFFTPYPLAGIFGVFKLLEMVGLVAWLVEKKSVLFSKLTIASLFITILFQSLLAIYQFTAQRSFFGYLFFGEPSLAMNPSIAKTVYFGSLRMLPYGTTPHPNVLAGFLCVSVLVVLFLLQTKRIAVFPGVFVVLLSVFTLHLTSSITAIVAFWVGAVLLLTRFQPIKLFTMGLVLTIPLTIALLPQTSSSISRRNQLQHIAIQEITDHPIFGVGINQFTAYVDTYGGVIAPTKFLQPAHTAFFLIPAEFGVFGIIILFLLWKIEHKRYTVQYDQYTWLIFPFLLMLSLDHYLITLQQGQLLLACFLAILVIKKKNDKLRTIEKSLSKK